MNPLVLNRIFLVVGLIGLPVCIYFARRSGKVPALLGIGLFGYLVVSSIIVEIRQAIQR